MPLPLLALFTHGPSHSKAVKSMLLVHYLINSSASCTIILSLHGTAIATTSHSASSTQTRLFLIQLLADLHDNYFTNSYMYCLNAPSIMLPMSQDGIAAAIISIYI